ncbi:MAG: hypothetical protein R3281_02300 [Balneolaceae bacterium]|nr:hypothetical protein [Balneolaceae bacterium]
MKKETLQWILGKSKRVENLYWQGGAINGNIWVSFSHSEVQPGEEIPDGDFFGSFLFTQKGTPLQWIIANIF